MVFKIFILNLIIIANCTANCMASWEPDPKGIWTLKTGFKVPTLEMNIYGDPEKISPELHFKPNSPLQFFLSLSAGPIFLSSSFKAPSPEVDRLLYGDTKLTDHQLRLYTYHFAFDLFYQRYKSYYIENSFDIDSRIGENDPKLQRSDLEAENWGGQIYLNLTPDTFSLPAVLDQSGVQTASAWGLFLVAGVAHNRIQAEQAIVPLSASEVYRNFSAFEGGEFIIAKWGIGTGYTGCDGPWFASTLLFLTFGQEDQYYSLARDTVYHHKYHNSANFKVALGYVSHKMITGLQAHADENSLPVENVNIQMITTDVSIFVGVKF